MGALAIVLSEEPLLVRPSPCISVRLAPCHMFVLQKNLVINCSAGVAVALALGQGIPHSSNRQRKSCSPAKRGEGQTTGTMMKDTVGCFRLNQRPS